LGAQSLLWFGLGGGAALFAISLLRQRYVTKEQRAVRSRGGFTLFAILMLIFAAGAIVAGIASARAGR
jgi:sulfite exporter TauE/SafE